jgi:hypothetical protein
MRAMRGITAALLALGCLAFAACGGGDDDDDDDDDDAVDSGDTPIDANGEGDAAAPDAPASGYDLGTYDGKGCLEFASAHDTCCDQPGDGVDECAGGLGGPGDDPSLCGFMAGCELTSLGQCQIDCEMAPTVFCITVEQVQCVIDAAVADDCVAAEACMGWIYFGE